MNGKDFWTWDVTSLLGDGNITGAAHTGGFPSEFNLEGDWNFLGFSLEVTNKDWGLGGTYTYDIHAFHNDVMVANVVEDLNLFFVDWIDQPKIVALGQYEGFVGDIYFVNCHFPDFALFLASSPGCIGCGDVCP